MERKTVNLLNFPIDTFSKDEAFNYAKTLLDSAKSSHIVTINPEIIETAKNNPHLERILKEAELVVADGIGIKIGLLIKGKKTDRIAGIDFAKKLIEESAKTGIPIALVGAKQEVLEKTVENLTSQYPDLNIIYTHNGYFDNNEEIIDEIKEKSPKLLLAAMGAPKQEEFIYMAKSILPSTLMIGIGGSFDVWAGNVKRAPKILQKLGLEWLYRTIKQPERFKRIFPTLPKFICSIIEEQYLKKGV
ncbi:WecB/TagA/CpsF family glycosyltransferase [bacterium]|nr:WecB/TagA/CpsF family glycosyltransferase [bacterium]